MQNNFRESHVPFVTEVPNASRAPSLHTRGTRHAKHQQVARQEGLEPPTHSLEGCRSIQLSYWRNGQTDAPCHRAPQVGAPGFEPGTSCSQSRRDTRLRYAPLRPILVGSINPVNALT